MSKQQQSKKPTSTKQVTEEPKVKSTFIVEDFFTQFLDKRQKNFVKKLDRIEELRKKPENELTTEQKELIANAHLTQERVKYFDDIKELYFQAYQKKEQQLNELPCKASDLMDLFFAGNMMKHLPSSTLEVFEHALPKEHQRKIEHVHINVFKQSHTHNTLKEAKKLVSSALEDIQLLENLRKTV